MLAETKLRQFMIMEKQEKAKLAKNKVEPKSGSSAKNRPVTYASFSRKAYRAKVKILLKKNALCISLVLSMVMGVGAGVGMRFRPEAYTDEELILLGFPGELLMDMLQMISLPLIVSSLISGITTLEPGVFCKLGLRTLVYYLVTTVLAVVLGIGLVLTIQPGIRDIESATVNTTAFNEGGEDVPIWAFLIIIARNVFPDNVVEAAFRTKVPTLLNETDSHGHRKIAVLKQDNRTNMLGIVALSLVTAVAINQTTIEAAGPLKRLMISLNEITLYLVSWIIRYSIVGVFFLLMYEVVKIPNPGKIFFEVYYCMTVCAGLFIQGFIILPLLYLVVVRRNPYKFLMGVSTALVTALATASNLGTLPATMHDLEVNNDLDRRVIAFVAPLGANLNVDGAALYEAVAAVCIGQKLHNPLGIWQIIIISLTVIASTIGSAGVPRHSVNIILKVLTAVNYPRGGVAFILALDWFLSRVRSAVNVIADVYGAGIVHHLSYKELFDLDQLQEGNSTSKTFDDSSGMKESLRREIDFALANIKIDNPRASLPCGPLLPQGTRGMGSTGSLGDSFNIVRPGGSARNARVDFRFTEIEPDEDSVISQALVIRQQEEENQEAAEDAEHYRRISAQDREREARLNALLNS